MAKSTKFDPILILRQIARDPKSPAHARVAACKALLAAEKVAGDDKATVPSDTLTRRALRIVNGGKS